MKITQIVETTTSGSVATVATPLFKQSRKGGNLLTGTKTKKKYANSISEGRMKELAMDLSKGRDGLSDEEFKKKYGKTKDEMQKALKKPEQKKDVAEGSDQNKYEQGYDDAKNNKASIHKKLTGNDRYNYISGYKDGLTDRKKPKQQSVAEAKLEEDDVIIVPGQGHKLKSGFIPHSEDRTDHEVEMALSDLYHAAKNAQQLHDMISNISEEEGLEGWVQEKIIKAADYLNTVREYIEHKQVMSEQHLGGVIGSGFAGEALEVEPGPMTKAQDTLKTVFNIVKTDKPTRVSIGNKSGNITPEMAKAIIHFYKLAKAKNKGDEILEIFLNDELFKKLLKNPTYRKLVHKYTQEKVSSPEGKRATAFYDMVSKQPETKQKGWIAEKAVSKAQQRFMGMVHAAQKGEKPASKEVAKVAKDMPKKAAKDFAQTKHKGLPEKKKD